MLNFDCIFMAPGAVEMTFAEKQLAKYGWKKGMGLGKKNDGISEPIKVKTCKNNLGIGNDPKKHLTHWWDMAYNRAVNNIVVERSENGHIEVKSSTVCSITQEKPNLFNTNVLYDDFMQAGTLKGIQFTSNKTDAENESRGVSGVKGLLLDMTDAELLKLCGGGTAHKGARHGIRMGGKMKRIKAMEEADAARAALKRQAEQGRPHETAEKNKLEDNQKYLGRQDCEDEDDIQPLLSDRSCNDTRNPLDVSEKVFSGAVTEIPKKKKKKSKNEGNNESSKVEILNNTRNDNSPDFDEGKGSSPELHSDESICKATKKKKRKRSDAVDALIGDRETSVESPVGGTQQKKKKRKHKVEDSLDDEGISQQTGADVSGDLKRNKKKESEYRSSELKNESKGNFNPKKNKKKSGSKELGDETPAILEIHQTSEETIRKKMKRKR